MTTFDLADLPDTLRRERKARGWKLAQLSERCGLSISYLSDIERGRTQPALDTLNAIFAALDLRLVWQVEDAQTDPHEAVKANITRAVERQDWPSALLYLSGLMLEQRNDQ